MKKAVLVFFAVITMACGGCKSGMVDNNYSAGTERKLAAPPEGQIYHAAFPGIGVPEDIVTTQKISAFEKLAGKKIAWVYFSDNWFNGQIKFPLETVNLIHEYGSVPFLRLMPRANYGGKCPDSIFSLQKIIDGVFDNQLIQWARDAKKCGIPFLAEFGTECNGQWFSWNEEFNGRNNKIGYGNSQEYDGMERFRDAYRHIIKITREQGALNITWFFHINVPGDPTEDWNTMKGYYPGDDYIDWIGLSVYGPQSKEEKWKSFAEILDESLSEIKGITNSGKPIALLEWGVDENPAKGKKADWVKEMLNSVKAGGKYFPLIKAVSVWHSSFSITNLRIDSSPESLEAYQSCIKDSSFISNLYFKK